MQKYASLPGVLSVETTPDSLNMAARKTVPMKYIADLPKYQHEKPYQLIDIEQDPNDEIQATNLEYEFRQTLLLDLRTRQPDLDLEKDSFKYVKHATKSEPSTSTDAVLAYCSEMMELLRQHIHTEKTLCYDMRVRYFNELTAPSDIP